MTQRDRNIIWRKAAREALRNGNKWMMLTERPAV